MTHYYYDSKANKFYRPLDRMPPEKTLESIVDDIEAFSIYEPLWDAFHTYLSTLQPIPHAFSGHSRVVPEGEIEWRYEVKLRDKWEEFSKEGYEQATQSYPKRRVATPKITEGKCHVCGKEGGGHYLNCTEHFKPLTAQPDKQGEEGKKPTEGDQDLVVDFMSRFINEAALLIEGKFITGFENVFSVEGRGFTLSLIPINANLQFDVPALFETEGWDNVKSILYDRNKHEWVISYKNNLPENRFGLFRDAYLFLHSESNQP